MSGSRELAEHCLDLLTELEGIELRRFFGGWALTSEGTQFAIVMDRLYLRVGDELSGRLATAGGEPFRYRAKGRTVEVGRYLSVPPETMERSDELAGLATEAIDAARRRGRGRSGGAAR